MALAEFDAQSPSAELDNEWALRSFDPWDQRLSHSNIWRLYEALRRHTPVGYSEACEGFYLLSRYEDYLAVAMGGLRYPFTTDKRKTFMGMDVSVRDGGRQIEYEHQDPRIHQLYIDELARRGLTARMDAVLGTGA